MKHVLLFVMSIMLVQYSKAQQAPQPVSTDPKNIVYLELCGVGGLYSFNYQRQIFLSKRLILAPGFSFTPFYPNTSGIEGGYGRNMPSVALMLQGIYRFGKNEIGIGIARGYYTYFALTDAGSTRQITSVTMGQIGYSHTYNKHIYVGFYFTPQISDSQYTQFIPWGGIRIGYKFGR